METMTDFIFLGSKIIADGDHSYEISHKARLLSDLDLETKQPNFGVWQDYPG